MSHVLSTTRPLARGVAVLTLLLGLGASGCSLGGGSEAPTETSSASSGTDGAGGKPSQEDVAAGLRQVIVEMAPSMADAQDDMINRLTACTVGKIYDSVTTISLQAMADGDLSGAHPDDLTALSNATAQCSTELKNG